MSYSRNFVPVPSLSIPNGKRKVKDLALYLLDMVEILQTQETAVDLMLSSTRPDNPRIQALWKELARAISGFGNSLISPLESEIQKHAATDMDVKFEGVLADQFIDGTVVTYNLIYSLFKQSSMTLNEKLVLWEETYPDIALSDTKEVCARSTSEIVMEALLVANRNWPRANRADHELWLSSLVDTKFNGQGPGLLGPRDPIRSPEFKQRYQYKGRNSRLSYGSVACSCATWNGTKLLTGTTLLKLGSLEQLTFELKDGRETVQTWFRRLRQSRFAPDEQDLLNRIIQPAMNDYHKGVTARSKGHSVQSIRDRSKPLIKPNLDEPGLSKQDKATRTREATKASVVLRRELTTQLPKVQEAVLEQLIKYGAKYVPTATAEAFEAKSVLGMAYEGTSYELKRKCPVCDAIFRFAFASPLRLATLVQDWERVGEADPTRINSPRGCCAEALVAVLLASNYDVLQTSLKQLRTAEKHSLPAYVVPIPERDPLT